MKKDNENTQKEKSVLSGKDKLVIDRIRELLPDAPSYWVDLVAKKMRRTTDSVYAYVRGDRGIKKGQHKEVLRLLKGIVDKTLKEDEDLLS